MITNEDELISVLDELEIYTVDDILSADDDKLQTIMKKVKFYDRIGFDGKQWVMALYPNLKADDYTMFIPVEREVVQEFYIRSLLEDITLPKYSI